MNAFKLGALFVPAPELITLLLAATLSFGIWAALRHTDLGKALRASAEDSAVAAAFGVPPDSVACRHIGSLWNRKCEGREWPFDVDPFRLMDRRDGTHHFWRLGNMRRPYGQQRNSTQICEQAHTAGGQFVAPRVQGRMHAGTVVLKAVLA